MKFLALTTLVLIGTSFISGCNNSASGNKDKNVTKTAEEYVVLDNYYLLISDDYKTDFDSAIKKINPTSTSKLNVVLDDSKFEIFDNQTSFLKYSGTIKNDEELKFEYQDFFMLNGKGEVDFNVNIEENSDNYNESSSKKLRYDEMKKLNETGSFLQTMFPRIYKSKVALNVIPYCITRDIISTNAAQSPYPTILKHNGDFLCTDVFGMKLNSKYEYGADFIIEFDVLSPYINDKYSSVNMSEDEELLEKTKTNLKSSITDGSDDFNTTIKFSDGEWGWYNSSGNLVNNGKYQESKQHKGLIAMYVTKESKRYHSSYSIPLILYIDKKGDIYYPAFIKYD